MSDPSPIPVRRVYDVRQAKPKENASGVDASAVPTVTPSGPRKLIRPQLPVDAHPGRYTGRIATPPSSRWNLAAAPAGDSHAEAFYFQKQIHSQTPMIFVLEDGEQVEGTIEWYDLHSIKVKRGNVRTLIYKAGIKYLYKATDSNGSSARL
jgi:sRNA-binding regulator protein Hfq